MTQTSEVTAVNSQLAFMSDLGMPRSASNSTPYYVAKFQEQIAPEQSKYSTLLDLIPTDPTRLDELYEYVPSLRRSLRLSQAARCAPVFGSDYLIDDENEGPPGLPQFFKIDFLGEKKILALEHATSAALDSPGTPPTQLDPKYYFRGSSAVVPLPKPAAGKWLSLQVFSKPTTIHNGVAAKATGTRLLPNRSARTRVSSFQMGGK